MGTTRTSFPKGRSGNPAGRPAGSRNRASLAVDALLEGEAERIARAAIDKALTGDPTALKLVLDRVAPARRDRPIEFSLPAMTSPADLTKATSALLSAVAAGELSPGEAAEIGKLVSAHGQAIAVSELAERIARLEEAKP